MSFGSEEEMMWPWIIEENRWRCGKGKDGCGTEPLFRHRNDCR